MLRLVTRYWTVILLLGSPCLAESKDRPVISTSQGRILGSTMTSVNGQEFFAFRKIPYALPPINDLRFEDPVVAEPWTHILNGTHEAPACIQYNIATSEIEGNEDCLYLNVYTRDLRPSSPRRPVMIWIHGGAFFMGSGNGGSDMYGPELLMDRDIVLVTINYRLGPLGFLSTEDSVAPGNYGLLDQEMALRWVKKNIVDFGRDANSVTIFGESAGGASVEHHVLSQRSQGLFHRAISQSGNAVCDWAVSGKVGQYTDMLAAHLKCPVTSSRDLVDCLKAKDVKGIITFREQIQGVAFWPIAFAPRIDKERKEPFLRKHPRELLESGQFNHVPFVTGVTKNEGAIVISMMMANGGLKNEDVEKLLPYALGLELAEDGQQKGLQLLKHYFKNERLPSTDLELLERMISDVALFSCLEEAVSLHAKYNTAATYAYLYAHQGEWTLGKMLGVIEVLGVGHGDELLLLFKDQRLGNLARKEDRKVSQILLDFWTSFAAEGVPSSELSKAPWLPVTENVKYILLQSEPVLVEENYPFSKRTSAVKSLFSGNYRTESEHPKTEL